MSLQFQDYHEEQVISYFSLFFCWFLSSITHANSFFPFCFECEQNILDMISIIQ